MTIINYNAGDSVELLVTHADNTLLGTLIGSNNARHTIYTRDTDFDPVLSDKINIYSSLREASEGLLMTGINYGGPGHMQFEITVNGVSKASVSQQVPEYSSQSWYFTLVRN